MKISEAKIRESFKCGELLSELPIYVKDETDSTMLDAKAHRDVATRAVFIADSQTRGRGRLGRSFISESGIGLYMTLMFTPDGKMSDTVSVTAYTAVVLRRVIEDLVGINSSIKWVNDIVVNGKKLAGILTEGILSTDGASLERVLVGIGINVHGSILNEEIKDIATTIESSGGAITREALAAGIIELFYSGLSTLASRPFVDEYRENSSVIGKNVTVIKPTCTYSAFVEGITDSCELILSLPGGKKEILSTGEVSVRES